MTLVRQSTLRDVLRRAAAKSLEDGWLYLPTESPTLDSHCVVVSDTDDGSAAANAAGFPFAGLDTPELEDTADCALQFALDPSDDLLLESFVYYWRFDAWLPEPGAPNPLPPSEAKKIFDREFFELLKPRAFFVQCRTQDCARGAVEHSVHCSVHHYEMIKNEPCPFSADA